MSRTIDGFGTVELSKSAIRVPANEAVLTLKVTSDVENPSDVVATVADGFKRVQYASVTGQEVRVVITTNELRTNADAAGAIGHFLEALDKALARKFGNADKKDDTLATAGAGRSKERYVNTSNNRGRRRR